MHNTHRNQSYVAPPCLIEVNSNRAPCEQISFLFAFSEALNHPYVTTPNRPIDCHVASISRRYAPNCLQTACAQKAGLLPDGVSVSMKIQIGQCTPARSRVVDEKPLIIGRPVESIARRQISKGNLFLNPPIHRKDVHLAFRRMHKRDKSAVRRKPPGVAFPGIGLVTEQFLAAPFQRVKRGEDELFLVPGWLRKGTQRCWRRNTSPDYPYRSSRLTPIVTGRR